MKKMFNKTVSMLVAVCLMIGIVNIPTYAAVSATAPIKTTEAVLSKPYSTPAQLAKQKLTSSADETKVTVKEGKVKEIKKEKADNGQNKYYAIVENNDKKLKVEIEESLYNFVESNGIKDSLTITINNAKAKINNGGSYEVEKSAAEVTINLSQEKATEILNKNNKYPSNITVENEKSEIDISSILTNPTSSSGELTKGTLEYTTAYIKSLANRNLTAINNLLKNKNLGSMEKKWLNEAKNSINSVVNGKQSSTEKVDWLNKAYTAIQTVSKANCSLTSFLNQSFSDVFSFVKNTVTYRVFARYGEMGLNVINKLSDKLGLNVNTVFDAFVKMGVTKEQMNKAGSLIIKLLNAGEKLTNCLTASVSCYLNISMNLAAVYDLASEISISADRFVRNNSNTFTGVCMDAAEKVIKLNGCNTAEYVSQISLKDFTDNLKAGEKAIVYVECYSGGGHAITVLKEKNGSFSVYDINVNNGNKVTYSKSNFEKLMNGSSYYKAVINGRMEFLADSSKIVTSYTRDLANKCLNLVNQLLNRKGISKLAKEWLEGARNLINVVLKGNKTLTEKNDWLSKTYSRLQELSKTDLSLLNLIKQCVTGELTPLANIVRNTFTYREYVKFGETGINLVSAISKKYNLNEQDVFNAFVNNGAKQYQIESAYDLLLMYMKNDLNIFSINWSSSLKNIGDSLAEIKLLIK